MGSQWCTFWSTDSLLREQELAEEGRGRDPKDRAQVPGESLPWRVQYLSTSQAVASWLMDEE